MTAPHYDRHGVTVHAGDCLDVLRTLPDASVDAVVTDPPYGLAEHKPERVAQAVAAWTTGDREHVPDGRGFMGRAWDGFVPPPAVFDECLRVLRPGGHLLVFAGTRTVDLMGLSVRLAGFEIRDSITWLYGSGFPKSLDVGKAIDKARDDGPARRAVGAWLRTRRESAGLLQKDVARHWPSATGGLTGCVANWEGGFNFPTIEQWEKLRDLLGFDDEMDAEVWRLNGRKGTPGNERFDRVVALPGSNSVYQPTQRVEHAGTPVLADAARWQGWGTALKPASEPIIVARKPLSGTVAATVLAHGTGALNIDRCRVGTDENTGRTRSTALGVMNDDGWQPRRQESTGHAAGRWPANVILDEDAAAELDAQSGIRTSGANPTRRSSDKFRDTYGEFAGQAECVPARGADAGGASRFFFTAKATADERPMVNGLAHPTVKPLSLMRWLVRLVTPPGGLVLDPFAGSGTTLQAARAEGFRAVGIEREPAYLPLITARLDARPRQAATTTTATHDEPVDLLDLLAADQEPA